MNELLVLLCIILLYCSTLLIKRLFGTLGLTVWLAVLLITANTLSLIQISIFDVNFGLGIFFYGATFLISDIICEISNRQKARRAIFIAISAQIFSFFAIGIGLLFEPSHAKAFFSLTPRIAIASLMATTTGHLLNIWFFYRIRNDMPGRRYLWVRSIGSTLVGQLVDIIIFTFPLLILFETLLTNFLFKLAATLLGTPIVYLLTKRTKIGSILN